MLDVLEKATITSPPSFTLFEGLPATGEVTTQGYPVNAMFANCGDLRCRDMSIRFQWPESRRIEGAQDRRSLCGRVSHRDRTL
jgi:hypothetical protein